MEAAIECFVTYARCLIRNCVIAVDAGGFPREPGAHSLPGVGGWKVSWLPVMN